MIVAPQRLSPLRFHPEQEALKRSTARFVLVPAGRRSGKTELAKRKIVKAAILENTYPDANFACCAPTRDQAKAIYWSDLKAMVPRELLRGTPSESELSIPLITGATIFVVGMDKPQRIEGRPWNGLIGDEIANWKPLAWDENVRPALADRKGWAWLIGVPEGRNFYYDFVQKAKADTTGEWAVFSWPSSDILDADEIESARRSMDPLVFDQEFNASFVNFAGRAYYSFDETVNVGQLRWDPRADLMLCFDFNVDPGVAVVAQEQPLPGSFHKDRNGAPLLNRPIIGTGVIGEVWIPRNSNTPAVCRKLVADWGAHEGNVYCFGDATGGARGSAKVMGSDWDLIKNELRAHFGQRVSFDGVPPANPAERSRINAVNTRCRNGAGEVHLMVDRDAPHVIKDLEGVRVLEGGSGELDKKHDPKLTHVSDALGYYLAKRFPALGHISSATPLRM